jgi:hypothetical protein
MNKSLPRLIQSLIVAGTALLIAAMLLSGELAGILPTFQLLDDVRHFMPGKHGCAFTAKLL